MKPIVREMYEFLVRLQQSPFTRDAERAEIEELLERATKELLEPEFADGAPQKLLCHLMDLNIQADKPTANGLVYPREELQKALGNKLEAIQHGQMMVFKGPSGPVPPLSDALGVVERMHLGDDGKLFGSGFLVKTPGSGNLMFLKTLLEEGKLHFSMGGRGKVDENGVVSDYEMTHVVIERTPAVPPEPPEPPDPPLPEYEKLEE